MKKIFGFLKRFTPCFIVFAIALCVFIAGNVVAGASQKRVDAMNSEIQSLSSESDRLGRKYEELSSATGAVSILDESRVHEDDERIKALLDRSFDWSNDAEYTEIRRDISRTHGIAVGNFLSVFMPDGDRLGSKYVSRVSVEDFTSHLIRVSNNNYSYMAEVSVKCHPVSGGSSVNVPCAVFYTIDGTGKFVSVSGFVLTD